MITETVLGEGVYGQVFKCTHRITDIEYAVKIVDKRLGANDSLVMKDDSLNMTHILHLIKR